MLASSRHRDGCGVCPRGHGGSRHRGHCAAAVHVHHLGAVARFRAAASAAFCPLQTAFRGDAG